jgi:glucose-1-phosphate cytidylyltransferase
VKVVLFCGGLGTRLKEYSETIPKPLVNIGYRPIIWHLMRYYAYFGHKQFILCLGYRADMIKEYFLNYNECISNDFVMRKGGREIETLHRDIDDWQITFVDTGQQSNIGQRLVAVRDFVKDEMFLANYSDGLTDLDLNAYIERASVEGAVASLLAVRTADSFHAVTADADGWVTGIGPIRSSPLMVNAGFFVLRPEIFDYIREGEELVVEPFARLVRERRLFCHGYDGFWKCMDTFKDKMTFDRMYEQGIAPWEVWRAATSAGGGAGRSWLLERRA